MISADAPAAGRAVLRRLNPVFYKEGSSYQEFTHMTDDALFSAQRDRGDKSAHAVPRQHPQLA
jgi:hypothetical protein